MTNPSLYTNRQVICSTLITEACVAVEVSNSMAILGVKKNVGQAFHVSIRTLATVVLAMGEYDMRGTLCRLNSANEAQLERLARLLHAIKNSKHSK